MGARLLTDSAPGAELDGWDRVVPTPVSLDLLGGFELRVLGQTVVVPLAAQRMVAFLALHDRPVQRTFVAGSLWPDKSEARAAANLRTTLWRLRQPGPGVVEAHGSNLRLSPQVTVDVTRQLAAARRLLADAAAATDAELGIAAIPGELLPDWYEDWVELERERLRQLRLHALEIACVELTRRGMIGRAVDAGLAAVAAEPLRETATRALVAAHLAEGNRVEALRQYESYRQLLRRELGVDPTSRLTDLFIHLVDDTWTAGPGNRLDDHHQEVHPWTTPGATRR